MSTYADVLNAFNDLTGDAGRYHFTAAQVDRFANRALEETCERARYKDSAEIINIVGGTAVYATTADAYDIFRVEYDDEALRPITRDALRTNDRNWSTRTGLPRFYYLDEIYSSQDYLSVGLWEAPSTNLTSGLRVWSHTVPTACSAAAASTQLDIPDWASSAVLYFMLNLAFTADTKRQDHNAAELYSMLYEDVLDRLIVRSRSRQPKKWVSGSPSSPSMNVLNRLPQRITE